MTKTAYDILLESREGRIGFSIECADAAVTELICELLEKNKLSHEDLDKGMNVPLGEITKIMDGGSGMTLETVARALEVFGHVLEVSSRPLIEPRT